MTKELKDFYKQLHHIIRLYDLLDKNAKVYQYSGETREWMMKIKRGTLLTKEEAFALRDSYVVKLSEIYEVKKLSYKPQPVDYEAIDKIVMTYYKTL